MIKITGKSLLKLFIVKTIILFENWAKSSCYPDIWKKVEYQLHKKNEEKLVENYRPISLLLTFGKIFEKIIFNRIYEFYLKK